MIFYTKIAFPLTPKTTLFHHAKNSLSTDVKNQSRTVGNTFLFFLDRQQIRSKRPVAKLDINQKGSDNFQE